MVGMGPVQLCKFGLAHLHNSIGEKHHHWFGRREPRMQRRYCLASVSLHEFVMTRILEPFAHILVELTEQFYFRFEIGNWLLKSSGYSCCLAASVDVIDETNMGQKYRGELHVSAFAAKVLLTWFQSLCWISFCPRKRFRLNRRSAGKRTPNKNAGRTSIFSPRFSTEEHFGRTRCRSVDNGASVRETKIKNDFVKRERSRIVLCDRTILLLVVTVERCWHNRSMSFRLRSWHVPNMDLNSSRTRSPGLEKFSTNSSANKHEFDQSLLTQTCNSTNLRQMGCPRALALSIDNKSAATLAQWSHE